jgi:Uma2 family endonuclease
MSTSTRITLDQYHEMIRQGLFEPREEHHVELLEGEITPMSPVGPPHSSFLSLLNEWSLRRLPKKAVWVRVQDPVEIPELDSEPEPDLVWAKRADYSERHPLPQDVLLLIEISDSSLPKDRGIKAQVYAKAGIADYWIVNVLDQCIEVRRDPHDDSYHSVEVFRAGQEVRPLAFPDVALAVARIFPAR